MSGPCPRVVEFSFYATAYNAASWLLTGVDVARVGVSVAAARHAASARSFARRVAVMSGVAALAELARVAGRAPALLHVQRRRTVVVVVVVVVAPPPSHGRRQRHVADETETCRRTTNLQCLNSAGSRRICDPAAPQV